MFGQFLTIAALCCISHLLAEVTVLKQVQVIYDKSPKLRVRGSGFDIFNDEKDIVLDIKANGSPSLVAGEDYAVTIDEDGDGLILKLLPNKKWVELGTRVPPVSLVLNSVKSANNPDLVNELVEPVVLAQVLATPSVNENDLVLYMSASNELRINGTGFIGAKKVDLYFDPPIVKAVAYEDVSPYPLSRNQVVLRLRHGYNWRDDAGPLRVMGVDTGGGPVKVNGNDGVEVADVEKNMDVHGVTVDDTADTQLVYSDEATLIITGSNFNTKETNYLRFANGLLGNGVNYTFAEQSSDSLKLKLAGQSHWRMNFENLPGALTLVAVNAGGGFVAVGPLNSGKGRDVATVFERPSVKANTLKIFRTHSHELHIQGTGFPDELSGFKPQFRFSTPLLEGLDYTIIVISRTEVELTLVDNGAWRADAGPLVITAINTRGDSAGWLNIDGVTVAKVVEDVAAEETGGVQVFPMGTKVYQSALQETIMLTGNGFVDGMALTFEPDMKEGVDYKLKVVTEHSLRLDLLGGKKWRQDPGLIIAKKVTLPGDSKKTYDLAGKEGIRVAVVLADPVIRPSSASYHESQSKLIKIEGSGFTTVSETTLMIRPSNPSAYKVINVLEDSMRVQLQPLNDWLPTFTTLKDEPDKKIELQVASIDTGAGVVVFPKPIVVGYIVKDREGVVCDDSCEFAFDGVCDDGSEPKDQEFYENYGGYADDDQGGFFYEGDDDYGRRKLSASLKLQMQHEQRAYSTSSKGLRGKQSRRQLQGLDDDEPYGGGYYDDYYMENEDYQVAPCVKGTDCTDCGGVDAIIDLEQPLPEGSNFETCTNTCMYPRDGICDDSRGSKYCELGTDCQDCGPVGASNFTQTDDDTWWDDDDDYWKLNDAEFMEQTQGLEANRHKVRTFQPSVEESPAAMFLVVLEGMVYTVGAIFAAAALYLLHRWWNGQTVPFVQGFNSELSAAEFEMRPQQRMPVTPDEFRT